MSATEEEDTPAYGVALLGGDEIGRAWCFPNGEIQIGLSRGVTLRWDESDEDDNCFMLIPIAARRWRMPATDIPPEIAALQHTYHGDTLRDYLGRFYAWCWDIEDDEPDRREALSTESQQWLDASMAMVWAEDWRERFGPLPLEKLRARASEAINDIDEQWVRAMQAAEKGEPFDNAHERYRLALHRECCDLDEERYRKVLDTH